MRGDEHRPNSPRVLDGLPERGKPPISHQVLTRWIDEAAASSDTMVPGQLGHLVASTVVVAAMQRAVDETGGVRFLLKGGTYLLYRLPGGRATRDVDGVVRGDINTFLDAVDDALAQDWGPIRLRRGEVSVIDVPGKVIKPRRFEIFLELRGHVWRRIKVEIAADEAGAGDEHDRLQPVQLQSLGLPTPDELFGVAVRFQVAQKLHACSDPHDPPALRNDRARDLVDLLLLRHLIVVEGGPSPADIGQACRAVFDARAAEATATGGVPRAWPPVLIAHPDWRSDYDAARHDARLETTLEEAVDVLNVWIGELDAAGDSLR